MALNRLYCTDVLLSNYSLTHSVMNYILCGLWAASSFVQ